MTPGRLSDADVEEMERLAKRLLALCAKAKPPVDDGSKSAVGTRVSPERAAELRAAVRARLQRKGVTIR